MFGRIGRLYLSFVQKRCMSLMDSSSNKLYESLLKKSYLLPESGHDVLIIQPCVKGVCNIRNNATKGEHTPNIDEAIALIDSLEFWTTVDVISCNVRNPHHNSQTFFSKGVWEEISRIVVEYRDGQAPIETQDKLSTKSNNQVVKKRATAVLINWSRLTTSQLAYIQQAWLMPVYDRYTLVVQLFTLRSRTPEAKVQAKLAELGLLRSRIPAFFQTSGMIESLVNRSDFACKEQLMQIINEKETHLLNQLEKISKQRVNHKRSHRRGMEKHHLPLVAVVGYTNAGKTSLIRYLSKSDKLTSCPEVFATLDITHHRTRLPVPTTSDDSMAPDQCTGGIGLPGIQMLLLDTIGFMSDLPTSLLAAFRATLNECLEADLILHVVDISQPEWNSHSNHVEELLKDIGIPTEQSDNLDDNSNALDVPPKILRVGNKIDRIDSEFISTGFDALVSAKSGIGMNELTSRIQSLLMKRLGWFSRTVDISQGGSCLQWIYSNAMVTSVQASPSSAQRLRVTAIFTPVTWINFRKTFQMKSF
uniref:Hflx-type G domain-containing protein n=1 Tax=Trichobilharzia regenti TaxID=157069 RepID=A0AA85KAE6_TRIRE|nr:unnamed protein product [Trichobilharzia regenti]